MPLGPTGQLHGVGMGLGEGEDPWVGRSESSCRKMSGFPLPGGFVLGECPQTLEVSLLLLLDASWSWQIWKPANLSRNSSRSLGARHPPGTSSGQEHLPCQELYHRNTETCLGSSQCSGSHILPLLSCSPQTLVWRPNMLTPRETRKPELGTGSVLPTLNQGQCPF